MPWHLGQCASSPDWCVALRPASSRLIRDAARLPRSVAAGAAAHASAAENGAVLHTAARTPAGPGPLASRPESQIHVQV